MMIDPVEVLRPARAAEWATALLEASAGVPGDARTRALGLAAALAVGLGQHDQAAQCLGQLRGEAGLGQVVAGALAPGAAPTQEQVASPSPRDRDWAVLQCYRAGRDVPQMLVHPFAPESLAVMDPFDAIEELALAALGSPDPHLVADAMSDWLRRVQKIDGWGPTPNLEYPHSHFVAPIFRTVAGLALRGALQGVDPGQFGSMLHHDLAADGLELRPRLEALSNLLVRMGCQGWALQASRYDPCADPLLDMLFRNGLHDDVAAFLIADLQSRDDDQGVQPAFPLNSLAPPDLSRLLDLVRAAEPSEARTKTMADIELAMVQAGDLERLQPAEESSRQGAAGSRSDPLSQILARLAADGTSDLPGIIPEYVPDHVRSSAMRILSARGQWDDAIVVAVAGREKFLWVLRLGFLAAMCAELDRPDALGGIMGAVASLPLSEEEAPKARGMVLRACLSADCWDL